MKKNFTPKQFGIGIVTTAVVFAGGGYLLGAFSQGSQEIPATGDLAKVQELYQSIEENYYKKVDKKVLVEGALRGMTEALGDPYTTYLDQEGASDLSQQLSESFGGIGAKLTQQDGRVQIAEAPIKGTPAEKAGLRGDDQIIKVDGKETKDQTLSDVVALIRGKKGTTVKLTVKRGEKEFEVSVKRDDIPNQTVNGAIDENQRSIGKIQIVSFGEGTANELKETIKTLRKEGAKAFIIDVRQNPGGLLDQVEIMSSMFLKDGKTIVEFANNKGTVSKAVAGEDLDNGFKVNEPTAVLVDQGSASAAEIFAAALKESADIPVIGTSTFGKGTVQRVTNIDDTTGVKMTVEKWLTPKGTWINEKGVEPTVKADFPEYAYQAPLPRNKILKKDQESEEITGLNDFLKALGYETSGKLFTETTETAVKEIQKAHGLPENGEVDEATADVIEKLVADKIKSQDIPYQKALEELTKK